jgi:hypothetical protein
MINSGEMPEPFGQAFAFDHGFGGHLEKLREPCAQ